MLIFFLQSMAKQMKVFPLTLAELAEIALNHNCQIFDPCSE